MDADRGVYNTFRRLELCCLLFSYVPYEFVSYFYVAADHEVRSQKC